MPTASSTPSSSQTLPDARASDPATLGWMVGAPPPQDKLIRFADGSAYRFPQLRWSFSNCRELVPTRGVARGSAAVFELPRAERDDIDGVEFVPLGGAATMTWAQSLQANYTDGIVVLHHGRIVHERYFGVLGPERQHVAMSLTKSFVGLLGAMLIAEGVLDENAFALRYVPELRRTAFADATLRQLLDMTAGLACSEDYADPAAAIWDHMRAGGVLPRPAGYSGPASFDEFVRAVPKAGEHGRAFAYRTANADALAWVIRRVTGSSLAGVLADRLWRRIGAEQEAYFTIDTVGTEFAGGGLATTLRDLARVGELMRNDGRCNGAQVVPTAVVADIRRGGDRALFADPGDPLLPGWSYRDMWWVSHNAHGAFAARGIHGQTLHIDPAAALVIARYASHPQPANAANDPTSLPAFDALARHLMAQPR